jgi:hypothetical protein
MAALAARSLSAGTIVSGMAARFAARLFVRADKPPARLALGDLDKEVADPIKPGFLVTKAEDGRAQSQLRLTTATVSYP